MKLATIRTSMGTRAVRLDTDAAVETGDADVGALLARDGWRERAADAEGPTHPVDSLDYAPLVPRPEKILCVGLNYRDHIEETGRAAPEYPMFFAKFASALVGAYDEVLLPAVSEAADWEAELTVVVGAPARHVSPDEAVACIAGYTVLNDLSIRDYQNRTMQFLQGKTFEASTPLGPALVTPDELPAASVSGTGVDLPISCAVDGEQMQRSNTGQLVFDPGTLISYLSEIMTLRPGDVIATGTPGGVGFARKPPRFLTEGAVMTTRIDGIGECRNICRKEKV